VQLVVIDAPEKNSHDWRCYMEWKAIVFTSCFCLVSGIVPQTLVFISFQLLCSSRNVCGQIFFNYYFSYPTLFRGHAVTQLVEALRYNRKVAGSIPDDVIGIFYRHNPSGRTMALGLTQPLTEMSIRNIYWVVKAAGA
jgi:hypothetical protein